MAASYGRPSVGGRSGAGDNNKNASYGLWVLRASTLPETPRAGNMENVGFQSNRG